MSSSKQNLQTASGIFVASCAVAATPASASGHTEHEVSSQAFLDTENVLSLESTKPQVNLTGFLVMLGSDARLQGEYLTQPETTMRDYGLDDIAIASVMSGDTNNIKSLSGESVEARTYMIISSPKNK